MKPGLVTDCYKAGMGRRLDADEPCNRLLLGSGAECLTCGDVAVEARVLEVHGDTALVELDGRREGIGVELVLPVEPGDVLLCHAGIAIRKLDA